MKKIALISCFTFHISHFIFAQCSVNLGNDTVLCKGNSLNLSINANYFEDSLVITYDATQGTTELVGAAKVYFHSSYELTPNGGAVLPFKGNWGKDDSVGLMQNIGKDLWQITIHPQSYYGYAANTTINGLFMVFRNADGIMIGKNNTNQDIWMDMKTNPPSSGFKGATAKWNYSTVWSDGSFGKNITAKNSGNYSLKITNNNGCTASDDVKITMDSITKINLGNDTTLCSPFLLNLNAGASFTTYSWNGKSGNQSLNVTKSGNYFVEAESKNGCKSTDNISVSTGITEQDIFLGNDTTICGIGAMTLDCGVEISFGDSLTITYDVTKGTTGLQNATKVYIHSSYELTPNGGAVLPFKGNWAKDDSIGLMHKIAKDLWQITIHPQNYYGYPAGTEINGLFMVFRNADGSKEGKNNANENIWIDMKTNPPFSGFNGVKANWKGKGINSIFWSDSSTARTLAVSQAGKYSVRVVDAIGCIAKDSIAIEIHSLPYIEMGNDRKICEGDSVVLNAGAGYTNYQWKSDSIILNNITQKLTAKTSAVYSITVTDLYGCKGNDFVKIDVKDLPTPDFSSSVVSGWTMEFTNASKNSDKFYWDFTSDKKIDDSTNTAPTHSFKDGGNYNVSLTAKNSCGTKTITKLIQVGKTGIDEVRISDFGFFLIRMMEILL